MTQLLLCLLMHVKVLQLQKLERIANLKYNTILGLFNPFALLRFSAWHTSIYPVIQIILMGLSVDIFRFIRRSTRKASFSTLNVKNCNFVWILFSHYIYWGRKQRKWHLVCLYNWCSAHHCTSGTQVEVLHDMTLK